MKVVLIGNYPFDGSQSMNRFADVIHRELQDRGIDVELVYPVPFLGKLKPSGSGIGKWFGYLDKFFLFPFILANWARESPDAVFHICDHSNSMYGKWLKRVPTILTCHDLLAIRCALGDFPQNITGITGRILQKWILGGLKRSRFVACVSDSTRSDLLHLTGLQKDHCRIIHNGLNYPYKVMDTISRDKILNNLFDRSKRNRPPSYIFHLGGNQWYKNRAGVIRIYNQLCRSNPNAPVLVIAGKPNSPKVEEEIQSGPAADKIIHLGRVSNEELNALYSAAELLLFPSLAEGFGWPIIEAQASGCRVVTSDRTPMSEIGGEAALLLDPENPKSAANVVNLCLQESEDIRIERIKIGLDNASRYSTDAMIDQYIDLYKTACSIHLSTK